MKVSILSKSGCAMRTLTEVCWAAAALLTVTVTVSAQTLANPSFELGLTGWNTFGNASAGPAHAQDGTNGLKLFGSGSSPWNSAGAYQKMAANAGETWTLTAYGLNPSVGGVQGVNQNFALLKIVWYDGPNGTGTALQPLPGPGAVFGQYPGIESQQLNASTVVDQWQFLSASGVAPAGTQSVQLFGGLFLQPNFESGALWFDNEAVTMTVNLGPVPVCYVDVNSASPSWPYTNWATAAVTIQDAVDAADTGGEIVVTNGTYAVGGRAVVGTLTNRVAVTQPLTLRSVNGPQFTIIQGYQVPGTINGDGAIRCVYLASGATLSGFTLTNGATRDWHGSEGERHGGGVWCQATNTLVTNCVLAGNSAWSGGGACYGTLKNCTVSGNSAAADGGGAYYGTLYNCTVSGNSALGGGGARDSTLTNCKLSGNSSSEGGGAFFSTLRNCTLDANSASWCGGGAYYGTLYNCTVSGNSAPCGGGVYESTLTNCIVYFNNGGGAGKNYYGGTLDYCCTTPLPGSGVGNLDVEPQLADAAHLSAGSPCIGKGHAPTTGTDIDGEPWAGFPSIGCDEYYSGSATGALSAAILAQYTNVTAGFAVSFAGQMVGHASASVWDFGDGTAVSNRPCATHAWGAAGDYPLILRAYNDSNPDGVTASVMVHVVTQPVHYVSLGGASPATPYSSWATAATNIQDAVDAVSVAGALVLVSNGTYVAGGRAECRLLVEKPVALCSVNGPQFTIIDGCGTNRCAYLVGASLSGFTLINGRAYNGAGVCFGTLTNCILIGNYADYDGGGAYYSTLNNCVLGWNRTSEGRGAGAYYSTLNNCVLSTNSTSMGAGGAAYGGTLDNCTLTGNSAMRNSDGMGAGGGASAATLNNCTLTGNRTSGAGGGAAGCTLNNCTLTGNSAWQLGGGASGGTLNNCIIYTNAAQRGPDYDDWCSLNHCFTNAPLFVNYAGGNLRLQTNSPCINAGDNAYAPGLTDLDGNPRIAGGRVDIGAYEFQGTGLTGFTAWLWQYGLRTDGSSDYADSDTDGHNNWQEWRCLTCPTNALSVLRLVSATPAGPDVSVTWQSVAGVNYFLECSTSLAAVPVFRCVGTNLPGQPGTTTCTDTNAASLTPLFYRVGVGN